MKKTTSPTRRRMETHCRLLPALCALACLWLVAACGASVVDQAEERWRAAGLEAYRFQAREFRSIWCYYDLEIEVRDGEVVSAYVTANPGPAQQCGAYGKPPVGERVPVDPAEVSDWTVPHLFDIARALAADEGTRNIDVEIQFHPELGYPTQLARDDEMAYDDDWFISILSLDPVGGVP